MCIIISSKAGFESASALAESLGVKYENPFETKNRDFSKYKVVFKYGFSRPIHTVKGTKVLNKTSETEKALDKITTFKLLEKEGVTVPFTTDIKVASKWLKDGFVVARSTATGHNSEGITFCSTAEELLNADAVFYTKEVVHTNEFRINVWRDKVVSVYDKVNKKGTFDFQLFKGQENHPQLVELVKKVYNNIKLDWYGLDVLRDEGGNLHLLEVNSAPVLYPYTLNKLTTIISKEIEA